MSVEEKVKETLNKVLDVEPSEIKPDETLAAAFGVDSTEMVESVIAIEKAFGVKLSPKEITKYSSINDIEKVIASKTA